jgi:hypothetical protein
MGFLWGRPCSTAELEQPLEPPNAPNHPMIAIIEALLQSAIYCGAPTRTPTSTCSPTTDRLTDPTGRTLGSERVRVVERRPHDLLFRADIYWVAVRARSRMPAVVPTYMSKVMR